MQVDTSFTGTGKALRSSGSGSPVADLNGLGLAKVCASGHTASFPGQELTHRCAESAYCRPMATTASVPPTGSFRYGVEAPYVPAALSVGAVVCFVLSGLFRSWGGLVGALLLAQGGVFLHTTIRGKLRIWDRELDRLGLHGDERLLDLGCGRGAVLIAAAARLPQGRAEGVDLWRSRDQSGNDPDTTRRNAAAAGVADRIQLHTADLADLPFPDGTFDVVTSALAIHNIPNVGQRERAIREAVRVLKPGGRTVIADISHASD